MEQSGIVNIKAEKIMGHPNNPRKDLGDLSELAESIRIHGIMQNLTVVPLELVDPDATLNYDGEMYVTLIGHRRFAAGKQAGVAEFPCKVVREMSEREQMSVMLEENMQRADLTIWEQANGFQMMLDLGETEESIAEKTGFSRTTVRHRLNIAKLNQDVLREKEKNNEFQLTLNDLYALEQVEDVKVRDKILKEASSSRDIAWRARNAAEEIRRNKAAAKIIEILKAAGIEKAPKAYEDEQYSGKWETVECFPLDQAPPKKVDKKKLDGCFYHKSYRNVDIVRKRAKGESRPLTDQEREQKEKDKKIKALKAMAKEMNAQRRSFILDVIAGKIEPVKDVQEIVRGLFEVIVDMSGFMNKNNSIAFLTEGNDWWKLSDEDRERYTAQYRKLELVHQLMIGAYIATSNSDFTDYYGAYKQETGEAVTRFTGILAVYGFSYAEDEQNKVMEGSHEYYHKKAEGQK